MPPEKFDPNVPLRWKYIPIIAYDADGLYSKSEIDYLPNRMLFDQRREASLTVLTRHMVGMSVDYQGLIVIPTYTGTAAPRFGRKTIWDCYKTFNFIAWFMSGVTGFYTIYAICFFSTITFRTCESWVSITRLNQGLTGSVEPLQSAPLL